MQLRIEKKPILKSRMIATCGELRNVYSHLMEVNVPRDSYGGLVDRQNFV